jgi:hypothetical protein
MALGALHYAAICNLITRFCLPFTCKSIHLQVIKALLADWLKMIETPSKSPKYLNSSRLRVGTFHVKTIKEKTNESDRGKRKKKFQRTKGEGSVPAPRTNESATRANFKFPCL